MSRPFREKNKDLVNLEVFSAKQVWMQRKNGRYMYKKDLDIYGKVDRGTSAFVTNTNIYGSNNKYVEDTVNLPKRLKNDIVKHLYKKNKTAYLVKKK